MNVICVYGLYHLGSVTAACLAEAGFSVIGLDDDAKTVSDLSHGAPPLFEPELADLVKQGMARGKLSFTTDKNAIANADTVWITFDTPVNEDDRADIDYVISRTESIFSHLKNDAVLLVSSQLPVGSIAALKKSFEQQANGRKVWFACSPENLRLGKAIEAFRTQARIVIGCEPEAQQKLNALFSPFCRNLLWMSVASAEMTKHAVNSYLAMSVAWANEIATICEQAGADMAEVEQALRSEPRIGQKAYVRAGAPFGGGTLARDVRFLESMNGNLPLIGSIIASNNRHAGWPVDALRRCLGNIKGRKIAVLGLAYKPGTSSLRRSMALRWCKALISLGALVHAYDPQVGWDSALQDIALRENIEDALRGAEAVVIATEWDEFKTLTATMVKQQMATPLVIDQGRFLESLANDPAIHYVSVGRS